MTRHVRSKARAVATVVVAVTLLAATQSLTSATGAGAAAQSQKNIDKAAVLRVGLPLLDNGGIGMDPGRQNGGPANAQWLDLVFDVMIHDTPDGKGAPGLATKWKAIDSSTAELTLRDGVKFSDGAPFNAAAVKGAWDRLIGTAAGTAPTEAKSVASVEAPDDKTVRIHFSQPVAQNFLDTVVRHSIYFGVPSPASITSGAVATKPIGAGPYVLDSFVQDQSVKISKNPSYWNPKAQLLAGVDFTQTAVGTPSVSALQAGTVDLITTVPSDAITSLQNTPGLEVTALPGTRVLDLSLCTTSPAFSTKEGRQALQYALNRDAINEGAYGGAAESWQSPIGPTNQFYNAKTSAPYKYDVKKAKALLKKAGVAPGTTVTGLANSAFPQPVIAEIVQDQLKDVGLTLDYTVTTNLVDDAVRLKPDMLFVALDPTFWNTALTQTGTLNPCGWSNPQVSADLLTMQDPTKTQAEKQAAATDFEKTILDESQVVMTVLVPQTAAHTDKVKGIETIAIPYGPNLNTVYLTK